MFLQVSNVVVTPSGGMHPCRHWPRDTGELGGIADTLALVLLAFELTPPSHACKRFAQPAGGVGQQSAASWQETNTHCLPVGMRL